MKKFENISEFEDLLKEQLNGHSTPPPADAWAQVAASTAGKSAGLLNSLSSYFGSASSLIKTAFIVGGISTVGILIYNETKNADNPQVQTEQTLTTTETNDNQPGNYELTEGNGQESDIVSEKVQARVETSKIKSNSKENIKKDTEKDPRNESTQTTDAGNEIIKTDPKQEGKETKNNITIPVVRASNYKPCLGETITISSSEKGDWYLGENLVSKNSKYISATIEKEGISTYTFKTKRNNESVTILTDKFNTEIRKVELSEGSFQFTLSDPSFIANWYVNEKLHSTNASKIDVIINEVGNHNVRAQVVNHSCSKPLFSNIKIDPIGKFDFTNAFTPGGDGRNDTYKIDIEGYDNFSMQIFDGASNRVFYTLDPEKGWNGTINNEGVICPRGEYYAKVSYKLKGESPKIKSIKLNLLRN